MHYYDIHVFGENESGFSVFIKSDTKLSDDSAIQLAILNDKLDSDDRGVVDYVNEIDHVDYLHATQFD